MGGSLFLCASIRVKLERYLRSWRVRLKAIVKADKGQGGEASNRCFPVAKREYRPKLYNRTSTTGLGIAGAWMKDCNVVISIREKFLAKETTQWPN
jgi:hypothetical protein